MKNQTPKSWVIIDIKTGKAVYETFNKKILLKIDKARFTVKPIKEYLEGLNK